ncbi:MAG: VOC family protein [Actinomycetota bacterium]
MPELRRLLIGDAPGAWEAAGFTVDGDHTTIGGIELAFVDGPGRGVVGWELAGIEDDGSVDGMLTIATDRPPAAPTEHPNRVSRIDHVVITTPDLDRTVGALRGFGFSPRRTRDVPGTEPARRQVFLWAGETILEVVGPAVATGSEPARVWGLALTSDDLDAAADLLGDRMTNPKPAIQPGRLIATVKTKDLDVAPALALMSPHVATGQADSNETTDA